MRDVLRCLPSHIRLMVRPPVERLLTHNQHVRVEGVAFRDVHLPISVRWYVTPLARLPTHDQHVRVGCVTFEADWKPTSTYATIGCQYGS